MKFCLSSRQTPEYLRQADEIRVTSRDYKQIYDLIDLYPQKTIILNYMPSPEEKEKYDKTLRDLAQLTNHQLMLSVFQLKDIDFAKELNLRYFYARPATTLEQVRVLKDLKVSYVILDNQVSHELHEVKIINVPVRAVPNLSFLDEFPRENGIAGSWIRPEDLEAYSLYIDAIEFGSQPEKREQALFRIYKHQKEFYGDLGKIVQDLNTLGLNQLISSELSLQRMNCGMKCATSKNCTVCYDMLRLASHEELFRK